MKKRSKMKWLVIPLALVLVCCVFAASAFADNNDVTVTCDIHHGESTPEFSFSTLPFQGNSNPDLFPDMKGLMPGDSVTQEITLDVKNVKNTTIQSDSVVGIYLKAQNGNENYNRLLADQDVSYEVKKGDTVITGDMVGEKGVLLGTFTDDGKAKVTVTLNIGKNAGNELQNLIAQVDWVFSVEGDQKPILNKDDHFAYIVGYPEGDVRPENNITRAEVATIYFRLLSQDSRDAFWSTTNSFSDVKKGDWFNNAVSTLVKAKVLSGYPDGSFQPNAPITRAEMAAIASRFDEATGAQVTAKTFTDIAGHWAERNIELAAGHGWVNGYPDGTFRPERLITRAEAMKLINYVLKRAVDEPGILAAAKQWSDNPKDKWYYFHVLEATNSHFYERTFNQVSDTNFFMEKWTEMRENFDWTTLEK